MRRNPVIGLFRPAILTLRNTLFQGGNAVLAGPSKPEQGSGENKLPVAIKVAGSGGRAFLLDLCSHI